MPPRKMSEAIRYMPLSVLWVKSLIQPTANGLMKPARLPIELMKASPDAAAVPARNAVGRLQKSGNVVRMPILLKNSIFLPRSQFLRLRRASRRKRYGFGRNADFSVCGGRSELAMATRGAICPA